VQPGRRVKSDRNLCGKEEESLQKTQLLFLISYQ
jgi:hypothetical protein